MTLFTYAVEYRQCTIVELRRFVEARDRDGTQPPPSVREAILVRMLEQLDQEATIRFRDFPPDIRNMIYEQLLLPAEHGSDAAGEISNRPSHYRPDTHPEILLTCKQMYREDNGILYSGKTFELWTALYHSIQRDYVEFFGNDWFDKALGRLIRFRIRMSHTAALQSTRESVSVNEKRLKNIRSIRLCIEGSLGLHFLFGYSFPKFRSHCRNLKDASEMRTLIQGFLRFCPLLRSLRIAICENDGQSRRPSQALNHIYQNRLRAFLLDVVPDFPDNISLTIEGLHEDTLKSFWSHRKDIGSRENMERLS